MIEYDITLAVTAHSESVVAGPTIQSAQIAIDKAEAHGFTVEKIISLDKATTECKDFFAQQIFSSWLKIELSEGDLGEVRNQVAKRAKGKWIAFLDADDLFGENWIYRASQILASAERDGLPIIVHPEVNWQFDKGTTVFANPAQTDILFSPYYLAIANYYDSLCMAPRRAFLEVPYRRREKEKGFGYEDWCWNFETISKGWYHLVAKDTIIFKRRRDISLLSELSQSKTILWDIDQLSVEYLNLL